MQVLITTKIWADFPTDESYNIYTSGVIDSLTAMKFKPYSVPGLVIPTEILRSAMEGDQTSKLNFLQQAVTDAQEGHENYSEDAFYLLNFVNANGELAVSLEFPNAFEINYVNPIARVVSMSPDKDVNDHIIDVIDEVVMVILEVS